MAQEVTDDFFAGEAADLFREELQEMGSEFLSPHASPIKESEHLPNSSIHDFSTDSESDETSSSVVMENNLDKKPIDIEEENTVRELVCGCTLNHGIPIAGIGLKNCERNELH